MGANRVRRVHHYLPFGERDQAIPWRGIHQREITGVQESRSSGVSGDRSRNQTVVVLRLRQGFGGQVVVVLE